MQREANLTKVVHIRISAELDREYGRRVGQLRGRKADIMRFALERSIAERAWRVPGRPAPNTEAPY
jgi:hypothetical protein